MRRLLPLAALFLASSAAAQTFGPATFYAPADWPALERIAQQVPAFSGFTVSEQQGKGVVLPTLTDPKQETALRAALNADPYWQKRLAGWNMGQGVIRMKTPVSRLLDVARRVKQERPSATLRIDTAFGKVRLNAPAAYTRELAAKLRTGDLLVDNSWKPLPKFSYDVQPRQVSLKFVGDDPRHAIPDLRVTVKNLGDGPAGLALYCGTLPVHVITEKGEATPPVNLFCPDILDVRLLQVGETRTFSSFSFSNLKKLRPGRYAWLVGKEKFPFVLTK